MNAPCPLAVMDAIAHSVEQALVPGNDYRRELRAVQQALPEARAAVAELVEAARAVLPYALSRAEDIEEAAAEVERDGLDRAAESRELADKAHVAYERAVAALAKFPETTR